MEQHALLTGFDVRDRGPRHRRTQSLPKSGLGPSEGSPAAPHLASKLLVERLHRVRHLNNMAPRAARVKCHLTVSLIVDVVDGARGG